MLALAIVPLHFYQTAPVTNTITVPVMHKHTALVHISSCGASVYVLMGASRGFRCVCPGGPGTQHREQLLRN